MSDTEAPEITLQHALRDWEENWEPVISDFEEMYGSSESPEADTDPSLELAIYLSLDRYSARVRDRWRRKWTVALFPELCRMSLDEKLSDTSGSTSGKEEDADEEVGEDAGAAGEDAAAAGEAAAAAPARVKYPVEVYGHKCPTESLQDIRIDKATPISDIMKHAHHSSFPNMVREGVHLDLDTVVFDLCEDSPAVREQLVAILNRMGFDGECVVSYVDSVEGMHFWGSAVLWAYLAATEHPPSWVPNNVNVVGPHDIDVFTQWAASAKMLPVDDTYPKGLNTGWKTTSVRPEKGQHALQFMSTTAYILEVLDSSDMHLLLMYCDGKQTFVSPYATNAISKRYTTHCAFQMVETPRELHRLMDRSRIYEQRGFRARPELIVTPITYARRFDIMQITNPESLALERAVSAKKFQAIELDGYTKKYVFDVYVGDPGVFYLYTKQQALHKAARGARAG